MEVLILLLILIIKLCVDAAKRRDAQNFSTWVRQNYPTDKYRSSREIKNLENIYKSRNK